MIVTERPNTIRTAGIQISKEMGIKAEGMGFIQNILRSQIYGDKIAAIIRELACNSFDSHVEAGCGERPIEVTLPSRFNTIFKIRDFGTGMSENIIMDIYSYFGCSTKRDSNSFTGFMGIGKVAPLSYGDSFTLVSFVDGIKSTYNIYIDSKSLTQIAKLASESTTEENGVEICVAVKDFDIDSFHRKAFNLFKYFKVKPIVHGADFKYEVHTPIMKGAGWAIYGQSDTSVAVMGNIGYTLANHWPTEENITATLAAGLEINFEIGDLEVAASREGLSYSDSTKKVVKDKLVRIVKEVSAELNSKFQNCATLFDAHKLYGSVMDYGSNLYALRAMIKSSLKFNGRAIVDSAIRFQQPSDGSWVLRCYETSWRGKKVNSNTYNVVSCNDKTLLVLNDLGITSGIVNRVYNPIKVDGKKVYILTFRDAKAKQDFYDETGMEESNFVLLSSLPKISRATATGNTVKNNKHASKEFSFDTTFAPNTWRKHRRMSDYWTSETVDVANDSGVYVVIDGFEYRAKNGSLTYPDELNNIIKAFWVFGLTMPKIYGFKVKQEQTAQDNPNMVLLWDFIAESLTSYFEQEKIAQKVANRLEYDKNCAANWVKFAENHSAKLDDAAPLAKAGKTFRYMQHSSHKAILDAAVAWSEYFKPVDKPENDLAKLNEEIGAKYPMFSYVYRWDTSSSKFNETIADYVNLIDG